MMENCRGWVDDGYSGGCEVAGGTWVGESAVQSIVKNNSNGGYSHKLLSHIMGAL
jgi:hypothetical protein